MPSGGEGGCPDDVPAGISGVDGMGAGMCGVLDVELGTKVGAGVDAVGAGLVKMSGGLVGMMKSSSLSYSGTGVGWGV